VHFLWGRHAAHNIDAVRQAAGVEWSIGRAGSDLEDIIQYRINTLLKYQDKPYADN